MPRLVLVCSFSSLKLDAVRKAASDLHTNVRAAESIAKTVPQPFRCAQAYECAMDRIKAVVTTPADMYIAIENYLDDEPHGKYIDKCLVLVARDAVHFTSALSPDAYNVALPDYVARVVDYERHRGEKDWQQTTAGERLATHHMSRIFAKDASATDWYKSVGATFSRAEQVAVTVKHAYEKYARAEKLVAGMRVYPNFPREGVEFLDMFSGLVAAQNSMNNLMLLAEEAIELHCERASITKWLFTRRAIFVGLEMRGAVLAAMLAARHDMPFLPLRKPGKLPGELDRIEYTKEYGTDAFELSLDCVRPLAGMYAIVVDDLLATGGSMAAACTLLERNGLVVELALALVEVPALRAQWQAALKGRRVRVVL
jgi:adenine phosphoribosyltransferase